MATDQPRAFGEALRRYRAAAGLTQEELAEQAGLSARAITDLERGVRRSPYPDTVQRLAGALHLSEEERSALLRSRRQATSPRTAAEGTDGGRPRQAVDARSTHVPAPATPLIGRGREVALVQAALLEPSTRLVTLTGSGGTGKTRVALAVAEEARDAFPDGVFFVGLASISDPALVMPTIGETLGLREVGERPMAEILRGFLFGKRVLLVLDNLEHVLAAAPAVAGLLAACTELRVLATSRAALRVYGEREFPIPPLGLPPPEAGDDPEHLLTSASVQLFVERTCAVRPEFRLTREQAPSVVQICARLDGLPLAIELAAARMRLLTPKALLQRLDDRFNVLTSGARDAPERQQTLRRAIAWSYDLLEPDEQALFRRLGVFSGGATLESIAAVTSAVMPLQLDVLDGVESLLAKSLLTRHETADGEPRFGMLETIRAFALEQLELCGEMHATRDAHAQCMVDLAAAAGPQLLTEAALAWFGRLRDELDNIRSAMDWLRATGQAVRALRLVQAANWFFAFGGHQAEARRWHDELLAAPAARPGQRFVSLFQVAQIAVMVGDYPRAQAATDEVAALGAVLDDDLARVYALYLRIEMAVRRRQRDLDAAERDGRTLIAALEEAIRARSSGLVGEPLGWHLALAYGGWSLAALGRGDLVQAAERSTAAVRWARSAGGQALIGVTLYWSAQVAMAQREWRLAARSLAESAEALSAVGNKETLADVYSKQAILAFLQRDMARAETRFCEALRLFQAVGEKTGALESLVGLAATAAEHGDPLRAATLLAAADAAQEVIDSAPSLFDSLLRQRARAALTQTDQDRVEAARAAGSQMTFEQAEAAALSEGGRPIPP